MKILTTRERKKEPVPMGPALFILAAGQDLACSDGPSARSAEVIDPGLIGHTRLRVKVAPSRSFAHASWLTLAANLNETPLALDS
jgi:hypothetical protein